MATKTHKPWGTEEIILHNGKYVIKRIFVKARHRLSLQSHNIKAETWLLFKGVGKIIIGSATMKYNVKIGITCIYPSIFDIPTSTIHRIEAKTNTILYEISTPELDDVVRLEDDYGRA